jgi:hypothetical protein
MSKGASAGRCHKADPARLNPIERPQLEESDVSICHSYGRLPKMQQWVENLHKLNRPLLCTEYMARPDGSRIDPILGYLREQKIAAYNWGFEAGKSNTIFAWGTWQTREPAAAPKVWFHDILRTDGSPYALPGSGAISQAHRSRACAR